MHCTRRAIVLRDYRLLIYQRIQFSLARLHGVGRCRRTPAPTLSAVFAQHLQQQHQLVTDADSSRNNKRLHLPSCQALPLPAFQPSAFTFFRDQPFILRFFFRIQFILFTPGALAAFLILILSACCFSTLTPTRRRRCANKRLYQPDARSDAFVLPYDVVRSAFSLFIIITGRAPTLPFFTFVRLTDHSAFYSLSVQFLLPYRLSAFASFGWY